MTDYAALNVDPFLKCFVKSAQAVAGHIQGDFQHGSTLVAVC